MKRKNLLLFPLLLLATLLLAPWTGATEEDVYAILYTDKTLVFQYGDAPESGRAVKEKYPVNLDGYSYTSDIPWYDARETIKTVVFKDAIQPRSMGAWFNGFSTLESIQNLDKVDTSRVSNMAYLFAGCSKFMEMDLRGLDTSAVEIMKDMFENCKRLTSLNLSGWDTSNVTNMNSMFWGCSGLTTLDLSGFDTANVTNMGYMFHGCSGLKTLNLSGWDTLSVTNMDDMFENCGGLTTLDLSGFDTANVKNMGSMFWGCSGLTTLDLSGFNTANVTYAAFMFNFCSGLKTVDLSGWDTLRVTYMNSMFYKCSNLETIYVSKSFVIPANNHDDMFSDCASLVGGAGTKFDDSHTDGEYARIDNQPNAPGYFTEKTARPGEQTNRQPVTLKLSSHSKPEAPFQEDVYAILYADKTLVFQHGDTPESGRAVKETYPVNLDGYSNSGAIPWHNTNKTIKTVIFKDAIQPRSMVFWFYGFYALQSIQNFEKVDTSQVSNMAYLFADCPRFAEMDLRGLDTSAVKSMRYMFDGCVRLTSLNLSGWNTSNVTNMYSMFSGCSSLTTLNTNGWDISNVTSMGYMFEDCSGLTTLDVGGWDISKCTDMRHMFRNCSRLTTLDVSGWDTFFVTDMNSMFYDCSRLETIYASEWFVAPSSSYSSDSMFYGCTSLVGGAGTKFDDSHTDGEYARIDKPSDAPGYFTEKAGRAPVTLTLTLRDSSGKAVTMDDIRKGAEIVPEVTVSDDASEEPLQVADIFLAIYDSNGMMVSLESWEVDLSNPLSVIKTMPIPQGVDASYIKFMMLSENLTPVVAAQEL